MLIEKNEVKHYWLVKSLSRLLSTQVSKHNGKKRFCLRCLNPFWNKKALNKHIEYCREHETVRITMSNGKYEIISLKTTIDKSWFISLSMRISSEIINPSIHLNQILRRVTSNNIRNICRQVFVIIFNLYEEVYKSKTVSYT